MQLLFEAYCTLKQYRILHCRVVLNNFIYLYFLLLRSVPVDWPKQNDWHKYCWTYPIIILSFLAFNLLGWGLDCKCFPLLFLQMSAPEVVAPFPGSWFLNSSGLFMWSSECRTSSRLSAFVPCLCKGIASLTFAEGSWHPLEKQWKTFLIKKPKSLKAKVASIIYWICQQNLC